MKDNFCSNTDLLDPHERSDELTDVSPLTALQSLSDAQDLLSNWNAGGDEDDDDEESVQSSQLYDRLLESNQVRNSSIDSATYVPDQSKSSILGSLFSNSFLSEPSRNTHIDILQVPELNDTIFGFRLLHHLGAGTFAKVFLAKQGDLADREVVLKVSAIEGSEPQTLAQLQHTNVVPIYSVHEDVNNGLRAVCMPYFGGASLNCVMDEVWRGKSLPLQGQILVESLDRSAGPEPATRLAQREAAALAAASGAEVVQAAHTARDTLARLSYVQASAWITARLAEGLQHSHERNVIHRDIKPSNVLLSAEGQPLLLDFNVSQVVDCDPSDASMGGTLSYMAPEHLAAAMARDVSSIKTVNHRSDIYSLGLVLYEMLTGESPFHESANGSLDPKHLEKMLAERRREIPSLKKTSPLDIPWSLESIVHKSLSPLPEHRYASAGQFAEDLNRFLSDQPLKFAPELSVWEQIRKWVRRHPRLTSTGVVSMLSAAVIIPCVMLLGIVVLRLQNADTARRAHDFEAWTLQARPMVSNVTPNEDTLREGVLKCRKTLEIYEVLDNPNWQKGPHWTGLSHAQRSTLAEKVRELLLVLAHAEVRLALDPQEAATNALKTLKIAEDIQDLPASKALFQERARYLTLLKRDAEALAASQTAERTPAVTTHDMYMAATAYTRERITEGLNKALDLLSTAIDRDPSHYWAHFERALCHEEMGDYTRAISDLGECIGMWRKSSWAYFNRAHLWDLQGHARDAESEYTKAIAYDPDFITAYYNRGLVRLELREYELALKDFDKVLPVRPKSATVAAGRAIALEWLGQHKEADQEFAVAMKHAMSAIKHGNKLTNEDLKRIRWSYAMAISTRAPEAARRLFAEVLDEEPRHPRANYGQGMLSMRSGKLEDAIRWFDRALEKAPPNFIDPIRYRAISLARLGKLDDAGAEIEFCLGREPANPETLYAAACVVAMTYRKVRSSDLADEALKYLRLAIVHGFQKDRAVGDPDFSALFSDPTFQELTGSARQAAPEPESL